MVIRKNQKKYSINSFNLQIMNKKLLFAAMSLAVFTACSNDDFESQQPVAEQAGSIQFEVINGQDDAFTRASMSGNKIVWNANDGDLFTLYHGGTCANSGDPLTAYSNATYKANANEEGTATLTTPSMINAGYAIMTWPVDTTFRAAGNLSIQINETQGNDIENQIPYVSDLIDVQAHTGSGTYNEAGYNRSYPVYMRPMASQLIIKADYAGTDAAIKALEGGTDGIDPISITSVDLETAAGTEFTKKIDLKFTAEDATVTARWDAGEPNNNWSHVTGFNLASAVGATKLTTKCVTGIESAKFLMLPQSAIDVSAADKGVKNAAIVVNTTYGKVVIGNGGAYTAAELADAWYRYQAPGTATVALETETAIAGTGSDAAKVRYTNNIALGLAQVINAFSTNTTTKATSIVKTEPTGAVGTRYVKVLLSKLDMNGLHITTDKQLYDAVRVWKELGNANVTVFVDGDETKGEFEISQKTIAKINEINAELDGERSFSVKACDEVGEACETIVITGGGNIPNLAFIVTNGGTNADVALADETTAWKWNGTTDEVKQVVVGTGVKSIINKGTMENDATATLAIYDATPTQIFTLPFVNEGTWNIKSGDVNVQFSVTNYGEVNITKGAEYRQDGAGVAAPNTPTFINEALTLPQHYITAEGVEEEIGLVNNYGVFATVHGGKINNYGLIEHADDDAMTFITTNQTGTGFSAAFNAATNKIGRINLPISNKNEDNISISGEATAGFVSITVTGVTELKTSEVSSRVNYVIVKNGCKKVSALPNTIKFIEIDQPGTRVEWGVTASYDGLMLLSDMSLKQTNNITINTGGSAYLHKNAKMYVAGKFNLTGTASWNGYFGDTTANVDSNYITYE